MKPLILFASLIFAQAIFADKLVATWEADPDVNKASSRCVAQFSSDISLPKCPRDYRVLSHLYPTGTVFVTYQKDTVPLIQKILQFGKEKSRNLNLVLIETTGLNEKGTQPIDRFISQHSHEAKITKVLGGRDWETFTRDPFTTGIDSEGRPVVVGLPSDKNEGHLIDKIGAACDVKTANDGKNGQSVPEVTDGGNFFYLPGGVCVSEGVEGLKKRIGDRMASAEIQKMSSAARNYINKFAKSCKEMVETDVQLPVLSHIDEVMTMVKTGNGPCDFAYAVISPELGLRTIKNKAQVTPYRKQISTALQARIDRNMQKISSAVARQTGCGNIRTVALPVLMNDPHASDAQDSASLTHPNPVNGLVLTPVSGASTMIAAQTGIKEFDDKIKAQMGSLHIDFKTLDWSRLGTGDGGVHCATNQLQACQP